MLATLNGESLFSAKAMRSKREKNRMCAKIDIKSSGSSAKPAMNKATILVAVFGPLQLLDVMHEHMLKNTRTLVFNI